VNGEYAVKFKGEKFAIGGWEARPGDKIPRGDDIPSSE
jgi:hypothetical protein